MGDYPQLARWLAIAIIVLPVLGYVFWGRPYRRRMILGYFSSHAIVNYFEQFWAGFDSFALLAARYHNLSHAEPPHPDQLKAVERELRNKMYDLYNRRFGAWAYAVPLIVLTLVLYVMATAAADYVTYLLSTDVRNAAAPLLLLDKVTMASLAGAYLWIGLHLISRVASLSLLPSDLNSCSLRLLVAPALGYALSAVAGSIGTANATVLVAFVATLLPISDVLTWLRSLAARSLNIADIAKEDPDKLINLPGVDADLAARFQDQAVTTIRQFADCDPVQLSMRSGLDFSFVVSLVDEALVWPYVGKKLLQLSEYGWSCASDIIDAATPQSGAPALEKAAVGYIAIAAAADGFPDDARQEPAPALGGAPGSLGRAIMTAQGDDVIKAIAANKKMEMTEVGMRNIAQQIANDSYARFIHRLVREIQAVPAPRAQPRRQPQSLAKQLAINLGSNLAQMTGLIREE